MPALTTATIIGAVGLGLSAVGSYTQYQGQKSQAKASRRAEMLRKQQMQLESSRKRREQIRQMQISQAQISNNAANSGTGQGSSGVLGGIGAVGTNAAYNVGQINQSEQIGAGIFDANADIASAGSTVALGQGVSAFGSALTTNSEAAGASVDSLFGRSTSNSSPDFSRLY